MVSVRLCNVRLPRTSPTLSVLNDILCSIGDWYPERNLFQILIALTSGPCLSSPRDRLLICSAGPRFALVLFQYYLHHSSTSSLPTVVFLAGIVRTLSCGGWVYITSSDDHDVHDFMMILYIVCNIPWMLLGIVTTPISRRSVRKKRFRFCLSCPALPDMPF